MVAVDEVDELNGMLDSVDRERPGRAAVERPLRPCDRQLRVGCERVLHREHLHLDDAGLVGRVADLEGERATLPIDPEVAVALAVERRRLTVDAEDRARDLGREIGRDLGRSCFEDVVAHAAPRYRGSGARPWSQCATDRRLALELVLLRRALEGERRAVPTGDRLEHLVEVACPDLALVARGGVALLLERELALLKPT